MRTLLLLFLVAGCAIEEDDVANDLATRDLHASSAGLCTNPACAVAPCTPGCIFLSAENGCSGNQEHIESARVTSCANWCGLQSPWVVGCLRYRSELSSCPLWCYAWGNPGCWETTPDIDYEKGGTICYANTACYGGLWPQDGPQAPCVDAGAD